MQIGQVNLCMSGSDTWELEESFLSARGHVHLKALLHGVYFVAGDLGK